MRKLSDHQTEPPASLWPFLFARCVQILAEHEGTEVSKQHATMRTIRHNDANAFVTDACLESLTFSRSLCPVGRRARITARNLQEVRFVGTTESPF